jgi:hypothetical protein
VHYDWSARSPLLADEGDLGWKSQYIIGSNNAGNDAYIVDAESREFSLSLAYGVNRDLELNIELPVRWQGGGVFDGLIEDWHDYFGLPQGGRDEIDHDQFQIFGDLTNGQRFRIERKGTEVGNVTLIGRYAALRSPELPVTVETIFSLPTATGGSGHDGIDTGLGLVSMSGWRDLNIFMGVAGFYATDPAFEDLKYRRWWGQGFTTLEWMLEEYSLTTGLFYSSGKVDNIQNHNHHVLYLDIAVVVDISTQTKIELLLRENIDPGDSSSDFAVMLGLRTVLPEREAAGGNAPEPQATNG